MPEMSQETIRFIAGSVVVVILATMIVTGVVIIHLAEIFRRERS